MWNFTVFEYNLRTVTQGLRDFIQEFDVYLKKTSYDIQRCPR